MTRRIPLSRGLVALVDDCDYARVSQFKWSADGNGYACRMVTIGHKDGKRIRRKIMLHRFILDAPPDKQVDHRNHDLLDNRRGNLRLATVAQNRANARPVGGGTSSFRGVWCTARDEQWRAEIVIRGTRHHLGHFACEQQAAQAYDHAALAAWGEFAYLNFPEQKHLYQLGLTAAAVPKRIFPASN